MVHSNLLRPSSTILKANAVLMTLVPRNKKEQYCSFLILNPVNVFPALCYWPCSCKLELELFQMKPTVSWVTTLHLSPEAQP